MYLNEIVEEIYENNPEIENLAMAHNVGCNPNALNELPAEIIKIVQSTIREQYGEIIELYHGSEVELDAKMIWRENTSFTDEFDIEFAGEDGYIIVAQVPTDRIKFFLNEENEFVISAGQLDCTVETVRNYFGL